MKNTKKSNLTRAIHRFDIELKRILMNDLKAVRSTKNQIFDNIKSIHKDIEQHHWTVA
jgi:hypothetical protein